MCCRRDDWDIETLSPPPYSIHGVDFLVFLRCAAVCCARAPARPPAGSTWGAAVASLREAWLPCWYSRMLLSAALLYVPLRGVLAAPAAFAVALCATWLLLPRRVVAERVLALPGGGLQCAAVREDGTVVLRPHLPAAALSSVALREGLRRCGVEWYLCAVVRGGSGGGGGAARPALFLPLLHARPRLPGLVHLLRGLRTVFPVVARR